MNATPHRTAHDEHCYQAANCNPYTAIRLAANLHWNRLKDTERQRHRNWARQRITRKEAA